MNRKVFYLDLIERTAWTAAQAAGAVVIETGISDFAGWAFVRNAAILAVIKALLVNQLPWTGRSSASTLSEKVVEETGDVDRHMVTAVATAAIAVVVLLWALGVDFPLDG